MRTPLTIAIMLLAQPIFTFIYVQTWPRATQSPWGLVAILLAALVVAAAVLTSRWSRQAQIVAGLVYVPLATVSFLTVGLWAACSVGDCI